MADQKLIYQARKKSKASLDFGIIGVLLSGLFWAYSYKHQDAYGTCTGAYRLMIHLEWLGFLSSVICFRAIHVGVSGMMIRGRANRHGFDLQALAGIFLGCLVLLAPASMLQKRLNEMQGFFQILLDFLRFLIVLWGLPLMVYVGVLGAFKNARALKSRSSDINLILQVICVIMALAGLFIYYFLWAAGHGLDCWHAG